MRPQILQMASAMEDKLNKNLSKGGWGECGAEYLLMRLKQEVLELEHTYLFQHRPKFIKKEAADVANFAMMVADCAGCFGDTEKV